MLVERIDSFDALTRAKHDWDAVHASDPDATGFISWEWISRWYRDLNTYWFVLGARPDASSPYVAFFPLQMSVGRWSGGGYYNEIKMGCGDYADYAGFLCDPASQEEAIPAFAQYLLGMNWAKFHFKHVMTSEKRIRLFLKAFERSRFQIEKIARIEPDGLDCNIHPFVPLPSHWDTYLDARLSRNTREKAKRFLKRLDDAQELRITHSTPDTVSRDLDILLNFWAIKWGPLKGAKLAGIVETNRRMFTHAAEAGMLLLPVLWRGDTPLGALALITDETKKSLFFMMGARDESFKNPPPGFLLHAHTIRWAIGQGFALYDFLQGNESYKYMFGAEDRQVTFTLISTRNRKNLGEVLDKLSTTYVLEEAMRLHKEGNIAHAEGALRQLLETEPNHPKAGYLLAQLLSKKGAYDDARVVIEAFLETWPHHHNAWLTLAGILAAWGDKDATADACRRVLALNPGNAEALRMLSALSPAHEKLRALLGREIPGLD